MEVEAVALALAQNGKNRKLPSLALVKEMLI